MKWLEIIHSFQKEDWHWFQKFVNSSIYNKNKNISLFFNWIRKNWPLNQKSINSEFLHQVLFADAPYDAAKIHHLNNYLLQTTEAYLAWDEWYQEADTRAYYLLQSLRRRRLDRPFHHTLARLRQRREQQALRHAAHYRFQYLLTLEEYQFSMHTARSQADFLQPLSDWHDIAFIAEKLRNACILLSRQRVLQTRFDLGLLPATLAYVRERPALLEIPAIAAYFHGYMTLTEPGQEHHFFDLKNLLDSAHAQFPLSELRDLYLLAINFCIHRINLHQDEYLKQVFELYKNGLSLDVFLENGQISRFTYTNIAKAALRMQEYAWTHAFLHQYRDRLPESQMAGTYAFNLARYYCETSDYARAMPLLLEMDFDDLSHNLTAKAMLLRMYYETQAYSALDSLLSSLSVYLRRKRHLAEQQRIAYHNLIRITRKMLALQPRKSAPRRALLQEIIDTPLLAEKDWLLRMLQAAS